jgi:hypothetical protein
MAQTGRRDRPRRALVDRLSAGSFGQARAKRRSSRRAVRSVSLRATATTDPTALTSRMIGVQANALAKGEPLNRKALPCSSPR